MASLFRTTSRAWQVVQVMENSAFSTVPPCPEQKNALFPGLGYPEDPSSSLPQYGKIVTESEDRPVGFVHRATHLSFPPDMA